MDGRGDISVANLMDKLPLVDATYLLWQQVFPEETINAFYQAHRERCYEQSFSFGNLVYLLHDAITRHEGRAHPTLVQHAGSEHCPATEQAFYGKLRRMPIPLSEAFLSLGAQALRPWLPARPYREIPNSLREFP